jgi:hypothetical protein
LRFALNTLHALVASEMSPSLAGRLLGALAVVPLDSTDGGVTEAEAGELLLAAAAGLPGSAVEAANPLDLARLQFVGDATMMLDPSEAVTHPLLTGWVPSTMAAALAAPIRAGAQRFDLALGSPVYGFARLFLRDGVAVGGQLNLHFIGAHVCLHYGEGVGRDPFVTAQTWSGEALWTLGRNLALGGQEASDAGIYNFDAQQPETVH